MDCQGLKAEAKGVNGRYFAYENGISYREKLLLLGFWHNGIGIGGHYLDCSQN